MLVVPLVGFGLVAFAMRSGQLVSRSHGGHVGTNAAAVLALRTVHAVMSGLAVNVHRSVVMNLAAMLALRHVLFHMTAALVTAIAIGFGFLFDFLVDPAILALGFPLIGSQFLVFLTLRGTATSAVMGAVVAFVVTVMCFHNSSLLTAGPYAWALPYIVTALTFVAKMMSEMAISCPIYSRLPVKAPVLLL